MTALAQAYTSIRSRYRVPARIAMHWAREQLQREAMGITWTMDYTTYLPAGSGQMDGFDVIVSFDYESDPFVNGSFTDSYVVGAIRNPNYRPTSYAYERVLQWFIPESGTLEQHRTELHRMGLSKHAAYTDALQSLRAEAKYSASPNQYVMIVTVERGDVELAQTVVHGYEVAEETYFEDLIIGAADLITETVDEAREKMAALVASL